MVTFTRQAKIAALTRPETSPSGDLLRALRGSAVLRGSFVDLAREVRALRAECNAALTRRNVRQRRA